MAYLRAVLKTYLNADAALMTLLPGGVLDTDELPEGASSIQDVPHNGPQITPFAMLRWRGATPKEIVSFTERRSVEIYFYQHRGYATIERAKRRVKTILERTMLPADDAGIAMFHWAHDTGEFPADELGRASADMSRYYVDYVVVQES